MAVSRVDPQGAESSL